MIEPISLGVLAGIAYLNRRAPAQWRRSRRHWALPVPTVLDDPGKASPGHSAAYAAMLVQGLGALGTSTTLAGIVTGPTVVRVDLQLAPGVRVGRLKSLAPDIANIVGVDDPRIINPVRPGVVGIELPRPDRQMVRLADVVGKSPLGLLDFPLGLGVDGTPLTLNVTDLPHLLVAGATGGGKSTFLNAFIVSLVMSASPRDLQLVLIDPKRTELHQYGGLPHLWRPVVTDDAMTLKALDEVIDEMRKRYDIFHRHGSRDIGEYRSSGRQMPYIVLVIDEVADLMRRLKRRINPAFESFAQLGRAAGIHAIIATQRPDRHVIDGAIKANFPTRLAFQVASHIDSGIALGAPGAETLLGKGDLLFNSGSAKLLRAQSAYVSDDEIRKVVEWWK